MGIGDAARLALAETVKAIQAIAEVKAIVAQVQLAASQHEQRVSLRMDAMEGRLRELEQKLSQLTGAVTAGYTEALTTVFLKKHSPIVTSPGGDHQPPASPTEVIATIDGGNPASRDR